MKYMTNEIYYLYDRFMYRINQQDIIDWRKSYNSPFKYVNEHRTLELKLPRQVGKSYFITAMAQNEDCIVVVPKLSMGDEYKRHGIRFVSVNNQNSFRGIKLGTLFLDEVRVSDLLKFQPFIDANFTYDTTIVSLYT